MSSITNFTFLWCMILFFVSVNILKKFSGTQLSYLEDFDPNMWNRLKNWNEEGFFLSASKEKSTYTQMWKNKCILVVLRSWFQRVLAKMEVWRSPSLPRTTKRRKTANLKRINNRKCPKIKLHGTLTTKELKKQSTRTTRLVPQDKEIWPKWKNREKLQKDKQWGDSQSIW